MDEPDGYRFGTFDFGLTSEQEERSARLHGESIIVDLVYWGPATYRSFAGDLEAREKSAYEVHRDNSRVILDAFDIEFRSARGGSFDLKSVWEPSGLTAGTFPIQAGSDFWLAWSGAVFAVAEEIPWIRKVRRAADIREAKRAGQLALFGHLQPALAPISRDLSLLQKAHDLGLRVVMLTYNDQDHVGAGCTDRSGAGVSNFGKRVIERCNELRMIVDTGHCNKQTTLDACKLSSAPVIASHTSAEAVYRHDRGKTDEELEAIAATGGVIGVVTVPFFLGAMDGVDMTTWLDHVDHLVKLVGWEHVAVGTDWPMTGSKWMLGPFLAWSLGVGFREEHGVGMLNQNLRGFDDYRDFPNITRGLVSRGYRDHEIAGILGGNALRVFEQVLG